MVQSEVDDAIGTSSRFTFVYEVRIKQGNDAGDIFLVFVTATPRGYDSKAGITGFSFASVSPGACQQRIWFVCYFLLFGDYRQILYGLARGSL